MKSLEHQAEQTPPLEKSKNRVAQQVKKQGAMKEAEKGSDPAAGPAQEGRSPDPGGGRGRRARQGKRLFSRFEGFDGQHQAEALTSAAFVLSKEHPYVEHPIPWQDNYYLLAFKERRAGDQAEFLKNREQDDGQFLEQKKQTPVPILAGQRAPSSQD